MSKYTDQPAEIRAAREAVNAAKRRRLLKKQPCERCGTMQKLHAHHEDYSKPLEVTWLCATHHKARHREMVVEAGLPITQAKSGYRGVHIDPESGNYCACGAIGGRSVNLGRFETAKEAARAYDEFALNRHGTSALLNFPAESTP